MFVFVSNLRNVCIPLSGLLIRISSFGRAIGWWRSGLAGLVGNGLPRAGVNGVKGLSLDITSSWLGDIITSPVFAVFGFGHVLSLLTESATVELRLFTMVYEPTTKLSNY